MSIHALTCFQSLLNKVVFFASLPTLLICSYSLPAKAAELISDGPYVTWLADGSARVDAICDGQKLSGKMTGEFPQVLKHPCTGETIAAIGQTLTVPADDYQNVERFMAISDVEGHYDSLVSLLRTYGIVDADLHWSWGKGHLVMLGDMVDRGDQVTEVLWLLYRLDQEAARAGGRVHYILGNHEKFTLEGDVRYLNKKYELVTQILDRSYRNLYGASTEIGRWMRTRNTMVKLNDTLFVHAGLAPDLLDHVQSLKEMNDGVRLGFAQPELKKTDAQVAWLLGSQGPLWYRGYFKDESLQAEQVNEVLKSFDAQHVVVGHSIVPQIDFYQDGHVIAIDTAFSKPKKIQALLFEQGSLWRAAISGKRERLVVPPN